MAARLFSLLLPLALSTGVHAETLSELVAKGCPSPDREWQAKDYSTLRELLTKGTLPLPRLESESGRTILHRLVDTENLSFHRNRNVPLQNRFPDLLDLMDASKAIMLLYLRVGNAGEKVEKELAEMLVFQIAVASVTIDLVEEFLPTIPRDEKYQIRMEGFDKMKRNFATVLDGAITSLSERTVYSVESVARIARGIREYYPRFEPLLSDTTKVEFRRRLRDMLSKEKNQVVKRELNSLSEALKVEGVTGKAKSSAVGSRP